jgi:hypothetical protein
MLAPWLAGGGIEDRLDCSCCLEFTEEAEENDALAPPGSGDDDIIEFLCDEEDPDG